MLFPSLKNPDNGYFQKFLLKTKYDEICPLKFNKNKYQQDYYPPFVKDSMITRQWAKFSEILKMNY